MKKALIIVLILLFLIIATLISMVIYSDYKEANKKEAEQNKREANAVQERAYSLKKYGIKLKPNETDEYCYNEACTSYSEFEATINNVRWEHFVDPKQIEAELTNKNISIPKDLPFGISMFASTSNFNSLTSNMKEEIRSCNPYSYDLKFIIKHGELAFKIRNDFIDKRIKNIQKYKLELKQRRNKSNLNLPSNYFIDNEQFKYMTQQWKDEKSSIDSLFDKIRNDVNFRKTKYCP